MTTGLEREPSRPRSMRSLRSRGPRQELTVAVLLGAAGAGLVFLATRQGWAHVRTIPPKPLPASTVRVTGAALVPYADALVLAGLATLAAILATRRLLRRLAGGLLAVLGAALGASAFTPTAAGAVAAAASNASPETAAAGSVMDGSNAAAGGVPNVAGAASHVSFAATSWQALVVMGAIAMVTAGALVAWRAERMAVMSSRYDAPTTAAVRPGGRKPGGTTQPAGTSQPAATGQPGAYEPETGDPARAGKRAAADSATFWEALSRGEDPTAAAHRTAGP